MRKNILFESIKRRIVQKAGGFVIGGLLIILGSSTGCQDVKPAEVVLSDNGNAKHSVVISSGASKRTEEVAKDLAEYLGRITGGEYEVKTGDGETGIAVGSYKDFPDLGLEDMFNPKDLTRRDEYVMRTHDEGVYLVGATDLAAQHAVWDFLYRIGYRQFFPTNTWEIVPEVPDLTVRIDAFERPDFYNRDGPRIVTWGPSSDDELWHRWHDRNRITPSIIMETDHEYPNIIERNKQIFDEHPEYLALVDGVRGSGRGDKFCISNEGLRQLVVDDAKKRVENNPESFYFSVDPSDGGDWCECVACAEMGSISDRVIILANEVAEAINNMGYGERYVGTLAYNQHSPPTKVDVHPKVIVSIATSFLRGGYTFEELIEGWNERTELIGIREYYGTFVWDQGVPRIGNGGSIKYLIEKIPYYYENGARFMNANSTDAWIGYGLGYYLSARLLWDVEAVEQVDELVDDFLEKSFGEAHEPMRNFFHMIALDYDTPRTNEDLLARMYGYIKEARELTDDPKVVVRLEEIALYTRYVELWFNFRNAEGQAARQKTAENVYRHAYRMQSRMMSNVGQLHMYLNRSNIAVNMPDEADPGLLSVGMPLEDKFPWKSSKLITNDEITQFIENGVATYKKDAMEFEVISFDENLEPAVTKLNLRKVIPGNMGGKNSFSGNFKMFTWLKTDEQLTLKVSGGLNYRDRGNVRFMLFSPKEALVEAVDTDESVFPDAQSHDVVLKSPYDGLHELEWLDGGGRTIVEWTEGHPMTMQASMENPARLGRSSLLYFYVPKGTETVGGYVTHNDFQIFDGNSEKVLDLQNIKDGVGYFNITVPKGQDGSLWRLQCNNVTVRLMTVPPYLARNEKELLLPKEVIEADSAD